MDLFFGGQGPEGLRDILSQIFGNLSMSDEDKIKALEEKNKYLFTEASFQEFKDFYVAAKTFQFEKVKVEGSDDCNCGICLKRKEIIDTFEKTYPEESSILIQEISKKFPESTKVSKEETTKSDTDKIGLNVYEVMIKIQENEKLIARRKSWPEGHHLDMPFLETEVTGKVIYFVAGKKPTRNNTTVWSPNQSDLFATDWIIKEAY